MASEAEYERLYQRFVENGGGKLTFDNSDLTPAEYWNLNDEYDLTDEQKAALEAAEIQYNRSVALNTLADEIDKPNVFTNPLDGLITNGETAYAGWNTNPNVVSLDGLAQSINNFSGSQKPELDNFFKNLSTVVGVGAGIFSVAALGISATQMYANLRTHSTNQVTNLPETMDQVSQVASLNQQFNPTSSGPCDIFNNLMGFMSGVYDGALEFVAGVKDKLAALIPQSIKNAIDTVKGVIDNFTLGGSGIVDQIKSALGPAIDAFKNAIKGVSKLINAAMNAVDNLSKAIQAEINGLAQGLSSMLAKVKALAMAAMSLDPCKVDVLKRAGNDTINGAISTLNNPMGSIPSPVQTEVDPRANPADVASKLANAEKAALGEAGVPQSPIKANATGYSAQNAYLHSNASRVTGVETHKSEPVKDSVTGAKTSKPTKKTAKPKDIGWGKGRYPTNSEAYHEWIKKYNADVLSQLTEIRELIGNMEYVISAADFGDYTDSQKSYAVTASVELGESKNKLQYDAQRIKENLQYYATFKGNKEKHKEEETWETYKSYAVPTTESMLKQAKALIAKHRAWYDSIDT